MEKNLKSTAKPLAVYIHWPFCKAKCPYCDFNSHVRDQVDQARWREALLKELDHMAAMAPGVEVESIFFGGGTPSLMPPDTAKALVARVHELFPVAKDIEITLEANPTSVEADTFANFAKAGVNRVSLGVQSLSQEDLAFLGRQHNVKEALAAVARARDHFARYSFDLIYARPKQTLASWEKELREALSHAVAHISLYQLTIEENTAFHHAYAKGDFTLPGEEESEALYRLTEEVMNAHGLFAYEVSNYAKPGEESRHNLAYWKGHDYIGIGPGAHGRLTVDGKRVATQTIKSPERWLEAVHRQGHAVEVWDELNLQQAMEERLMMGLRLSEGIDALPFAPHIDAKKRAFLASQGLLVERDDKLQATLAGRLVLNELIPALLP